MINLPLPPEEYNSTYQAELTNNLRELEEKCVKLDEDNFVITGGLILKDTSNNSYYKLKVTGGSLGVTEVTKEQSSNPYV